MSKLKHKTEIVDDFLTKLKELAELERKDHNMGACFGFRTAHKKIREQVVIVGEIAIHEFMVSGALDKLHGVGSSTVAVSDEYIKTGHITRLEELRLKVNECETLTVPNHYSVDALKHIIEYIGSQTGANITGESRMSYYGRTTTVKRLEFVVSRGADPVNFAFLNEQGMRLLQEVNMSSSQYDALVAHKSYPHPVALRFYMNNPDMIGATLVMTTGPENFVKYIKKELKLME